MRKFASGMLVLFVLAGFGCSSSKSMEIVPVPELIANLDSVAPQAEPQAEIPTLPNLHDALLQLVNSLLEQASVSMKSAAQQRMPVLLIGYPTGFDANADSVAAVLTETLLRTGKITLVVPREGQKLPFPPQSSDEALLLAKESGAELFLCCSNADSRVTMTLFDLHSWESLWTETKDYKNEIYKELN